MRPQSSGLVSPALRHPVRGFLISWAVETNVKRESLLDPITAIKNATRWRLRGEAMRTMAEEAEDPTVRAMMLSFAEDYDRMARRADDSAILDSRSAIGNKP
jgi:predicted component of type VI protein secretion system